MRSLSTARKLITPPLRRYLYREKTQEVARSTYAAVSAQVRRASDRYYVVVVLSLVVALGVQGLLRQVVAFGNVVLILIFVLSCVYAGFSSSYQGLRGCQGPAGISSCVLQQCSNLSKQCLGECGQLTQEGKVSDTFTSGTTAFQFRVAKGFACTACPVIAVA